VWRRAWGRRRAQPATARRRSCPMRLAKAGARLLSLSARKPGNLRRAPACQIPAASAHTHSTLHCPCVVPGLDAKYNSYDGVHIYIETNRQQMSMIISRISRSLAAASAASAAPSLPRAMTTWPPSSSPSLLLPNRARGPPYLDYPSTINIRHAIPDVQHHASDVACARCRCAARLRAN
jgi:hypothetical protein